MSEENSALDELVKENDFLLEKIDCLERENRKLSEKAGAAQEATERQFAEEIDSLKKEIESLQYDNVQLMESRVEWEEMAMRKVRAELEEMSQHHVASDVAELQSRINTLEAECNILKEERKKLDEFSRKIKDAEVLINQQSLEPTTPLRSVESATSGIRHQLKKVIDTMERICPRESPLAITAASNVMLLCRMKEFQVALVEQFIRKDLQAAVGVAKAACSLSDRLIAETSSSTGMPTGQTPQATVSTSRAYKTNDAQPNAAIFNLFKGK